MYPKAIQIGIKEHSAKFYYSKVNEKQHGSFELEEPSLLIRVDYSWVGASLDGQCCDPAVEETKCLLKERTLTQKLLFCYLVLEDKKIKMGSIFLMKIIFIISKFILAWQFKVSKPVIMGHCFVLQLSLWKAYKRKEGTIFLQKNL